jgi:hypothetical protein
MRKGRIGKHYDIREKLLEEDRELEVKRGTRH